jgi:hypothetical protein
MGIDICAIMKHNLSAEQILALPEVMRSWNKVVDHYKDHNEWPLSIETPQWDYHGDNTIKASDIEKEWEAWETHSNVPRMCKLSAGYADFKFNRNTLIACPWPQHKYGNLDTNFTRTYILELFRLIGAEFQTNKIIYCPDSACYTSMIEEKARQGLSLEALEAFGIATFGRIPERLTEAVLNYFFIDDFQLDLTDFNPDTCLFNRINEEYFLSQKFGQKFIIHRL